MELTTVWFALIAVLWIGYFTLEGFDFGVGMLLPILGKLEKPLPLPESIARPVVRRPPPGGGGGGPLPQGATAKPMEKS